MPNGNNGTDTRKLSPDSWKILGALGTAAVILIGVTQYQIDRSADLVLERSRSNVVTTTAMSEAFRPRDEKIRNLEAIVTKLREERATISETLVGTDKTLTRIVDVSIQTASAASKTEGQLKQLLSRVESNSAIAQQILDRYQGFAERLAAVEAIQKRVAPDSTK